jgi:hypothetical protein
MGRSLSPFDPAQPAIPAKPQAAGGSKIRGRGNLAKSGVLLGGRRFETVRSVDHQLFAAM